MAKTALISGRIEPSIKMQAESILAALGIPVSTAIDMFYKQIIYRNGIPFDVVLPTIPNDVSKMTKEELAAKIQEGIDEIEAGKGIPAEEAFAILYDRLGIKQV